MHLGIEARRPRQAQAMQVQASEVARSAAQLMEGEHTARTVSDQVSKPKVFSTQAVACSEERKF
eukprot:scaffold179073_cov13-Tisochrysis_lutea.AAC.1